MNCHSPMSDQPSEEYHKKIILIGNPNVGKSVIFGYLTGRYVTVSNYPGTTVEVSKGVYRISGEDIQVIDTPGVNSLLPMSEDEKVTRDIILNENSFKVIQVCDSKSLERSLFVAIQLIEMDVDMSLILNMMDEAEQRGIAIDSETLSDTLGVPVAETIAVRKKGFDKLQKVFHEARKGKLEVDYGDIIEESIRRVSNVLENNEINSRKRGLSISILCGDQSLMEWVHAHFTQDEIDLFNGEREELERRVGVPISYHINNARVLTVNRLMKNFSKVVSEKSSTVADFFGRVSMHPVYGVPILLFVLYMAYLFVGKLGAGTMVDFLEGTLFDGYINPFFKKVFGLITPWPLVKDFFVGDYGIITMALTYSLAIILPIVGTFFIGFGIMEDSGYLPRLAVMVDRIFKKIGCNGKAILPLILGLGCDTMATLTTRILETKKERLIITLLLALGIPCSAQLGVVLGMLSAVGLEATLIWTAMVILIIMIVGYLASKLIKGEDVDFLMEIPPMRIPQLKNILIKTMARIEWYLKEAVPLFILGTIVLFILDRTGALLYIEKLSSPVIVNLLDLPPKAADAFIIGFLRRDYGAAGLFAMQKSGLLDGTQVIVSLITITLFIPCIANYFVIIKEQGVKIAGYIILFIFPFAIFVGAIINKVIRLMGISF